MAVAISVNQATTLNIVETLDATLAPNLAPNGVGNQLIANQLSKSKKLDADSTPAVDTSPIDLTFDLVGTTKDFDLTAAPLARDSGETIDLTGKELICFILYADEGNANVITFAGEGANSYDGFGSIALYPGEGISMGNFGGQAKARDTVGASDKDVRITGTATEKLSILAVFA